VQVQVKYLEQVDSIYEEVVVLHQSNQDFKYSQEALHGQFLLDLLY
jgi:hypothetical protein